MEQPGEIPIPRRALIIKPSALGDVATAIPVLRGLRRSFGRAVHVSWLLSKSCAPLVAEDSDLDEVVLFDRRKHGLAWRSPAAARALYGFCRALRHGQYDLVIDLQGLFRSGFFAGITRAAVRAGFGTAREGAGLFYTHRLPAGQTPLHTVDKNIALARLLGIDARGEDYRVAVTPEGRAFAEKFSGEHGQYVVLAPATRWQSKLYPTRHWRKVAKALAERLTVAVVGGPGEEHLTAPLAGQNIVDLGGRTSIPQMVGLLAGSRGLVSCDSATMHIAAALDIPQLALIGPTDWRRTGPYGRGEESVLAAKLHCQGCLRRECPHVSCMELLAPGEVLRAVERALQL